MKYITTLITIVILLSGCKEESPTDPGVGSGIAGTVTYEGKTYKTVKIGNQVWMAENLNVGKGIYTSHNQTNNGVIEKYCYDNLESNCDTYGGLYQWDEAMQYSTITLIPSTQGICPPGWHIPTYAEIQTLKAAVNNDDNALKAVGQGTGDGAGTNTSGFSALLGGIHYPNGFFGSLGWETSFWSSTEYNTTTAYWLHLRDVDSPEWSPYVKKDFGFSLRCIKD